MRVTDASEHVPFLRNRNMLWIRCLAHILVGEPVPTSPEYALGVNFQEVVHSALTGNAEVARHSDSGRTEWTPTRMPA